jgi:REP element-mobilizing transposase RayT
MPRQARLDAPGTLHHIIGRGIEKKRIFYNDGDRVDFLNRISDLCCSGKFMVYAWALMPNHFHLLARSGKAPLANNMRKLLTGYVVNFNGRHKRYGHLFQNRYKSIVCEDDPYLLELTRYIHLNPLRAGLVKSFAELNRYLWSGHSVIMGRVKRGWQDRDTILAYFHHERAPAIDYYARFVKKGVSMGRRPELVGGGLIRSQGGWSQVLSLRRSGERVASDARVLGSSEFVQAMIAEAEAKEKETLRLSSKVTDLFQLSSKIAEGEGLEPQELRTGSRKKHVVKARKLFCQLAVRKMGYSGAAVARFLGVSTSAVNRMAASKDAKNLQGYI